jgi:hypothetical protein
VEISIQSQPSVLATCGFRSLRGTRFGHRISCNGFTSKALAGKSDAFYSDPYHDRVCPSNVGLGFGARSEIGESTIGMGGQQLGTTSQRQSKTFDANEFLCACAQMASVDI